MGSLVGSLTTAVTAWPAAKAWVRRWRPVWPLAPKIVRRIMAPEVLVGGSDNSSERVVTANLQVQP
jgi:hypothetical protein